VQLIRESNAGALPAYVINFVAGYLPPAWRLEGEWEAVTRPSDQELTAVRVLRGLLQRGYPTWCTPRMELAACELAGVPVEDRADSPSLEFRYQLPNAKHWGEALLRALVPVDNAFTAVWPQAQSEEEAEFPALLAAILGDSACQLLEPQRSVSTEAAAANYSRVDYALELPKEGKFIFEVDGSQHQGTRDSAADRARDLVLEGQQWKVYRVSASNVRRKSIPATFKEAWSRLSSTRWLQNAAARYRGTAAPQTIDFTALTSVWLPLASCRIQLALLDAIEFGALDLKATRWVIQVREADVPAAPVALADLLEMLTAICRLYGLAPPPDLHLIWEPSGRFPESEDAARVLSPEISFITSGVPDFRIDIRNMGPTHCDWDRDEESLWRIRPCHKSVRLDRRVPGTPQPIQAEDEALRYFLRYIFRKREFKGGQLEILRRTLAHKDTIGLLPTGAGKSLTYQLSALLQPGQALVIDPLVSLMEDQVQGLRDMWIDAASLIHGQMSTEERVLNEQEFGRANARFAFIAPERLQSREFRSELSAASVSNPLSYVVIDEAHCVSEWGHDFRPAYLNVARTARRLGGGQRVPALVALTGTASRVVLTDIQRELNIHDPSAVITPRSFNRPELAYEIVKCQSAEKQKHLVASLRSIPSRLGQPDARLYDSKFGGIVFCRWVGSEFGIEGASSIIKKEFGVDLRYAIYSGTKPRWVDGTAQDWNLQKRQIQIDFKKSRFPLLVATHAFGMGIDKENIRYTIHYGIPNSLEAFYQEAGRAGRDGNASLCLILFSEDNEQRARQLLDRNNSANWVAQTLDTVRRTDADDVTRVLYFHSQTYRGVEEDIAKSISFYRHAVRPALSRIAEGLSAPHVVGFDADNESQERIIYRLSVLGVVEDYTVDWRGRQFDLTLRRLSPDTLTRNLMEYIRRYRKEAAPVILRTGPRDEPVEAALSRLVAFVYDEIEQQRRQATRSLVEVLRSARSGEELRDRLLAYLSESQFTAQLNAIVDGLEPEKWWAIARQVDGQRDAGDLLGQCLRLLESYPTHPGLILLSAFARMFGEPDLETISSEIVAGLRQIEALPSGDEKAIADFVALLYDVVGASPTDETMTKVLQALPARSVAQAVLRESREPALRNLASQVLLAGVLPIIRDVRERVLK
jgi:ATP-dependent DNA helicase RecQ